MAQSDSRPPAHPAVPAKDARLRAMFEKMRGFIAILSGPEHVFEFANAASLEIAGGRDLIGLDIRSAFPELKGQGFIEALDEVYRSGKPFTAQSVPLRLGNAAPPLPMATP